VWSFKYLIASFLFWCVLSITKGLSDQLKNTNMDMAKAADLVSASIEMLQEFCSDTEWDKLYKCVAEVARSHDINEAPSRPCRQRSLPSRLSAEANVVVLETTGSREATSCSNDYKRPCT